MKKLISISLVFFIFFIMYKDLTIGSLPIVSVSNEASTHKNNEQITEPPVINTSTQPKTNKPEEYFREYEVSPGENVLSIVEKIHTYQIPVSIEQIVYDFEQLNPDVEANLIKQGKTYKFPIYPNPNEAQ